MRPLLDKHEKDTILGMMWLAWVIAAGVVCLGSAAGWSAVKAEARRRGVSPGFFAVWLVCRIYCRFVHRVQWVGLDRVPAQCDGPLVVVSNHTAGVDPVLISTGVKFRIRWMMASGFIGNILRPLWKWLAVIPVARDGADSSALREAIRHVRSGGVLGIFPEGGIVVPRGEVRPFAPGAGLIVSRSKAPVLLVHMTGTPASDTVFGSLLRFSRSRVEYLGVFDFSAERGGAEVAERMRAILAEHAGWALNEEMLPTARAGLRPQRDPFAP